MKTLILKDEAETEQVEGAFRSMGLKLTPAEVLEGMRRQLWMTPDEQTAVNFIESELTRVRRIFMRGKRLASIARRLKKALPIWARDELLKHAIDLLVAGSESERQRVAMQVAAQMMDYDAASAGVLTAFLKMAEPSVRLAGARAFRALPWPEFRSTAVDIAADPDPEVAALGKELLARIVELHGK